MNDIALEYVNGVLDDAIAASDHTGPFAYIGVGGKRLIVFLYDDEGNYLGTRKYSITPI